MVQINGKFEDVTGTSLEEYLIKNGFNRRMVAVEKNGSIIKKADYSKTMLLDGDVVEIVSFVGGG